uniref:Tf2-1-like SH3-like domain-containing protein n=1 Tax=Peronospora matthiolae TaxID=2874970 RepID=A0AAV1TAI4_9STRA
MSTGFSPFEVDTSRQALHPSAVGEIVPAGSEAESFWERRARIVEESKQNLRQAKERQKRYYDQGRRKMEFKANDWVLVNALPLSKKHVQESESTNKLLPKYVGPFTVLRQLSPVTYKNQLPPHMSKIKNVLNVDQLKFLPGSLIHLVGRPLYKTTEVLYDEHGHRMWVIESLKATRKVKK